MIPNYSRSLRILIYYSSPPLDFFQTFITDDFVTEMAEQTNFYAVQIGAPQSFKLVSDGVINLYLHINIHTDSGTRPETIFQACKCAGISGNFA